MGKVIIVTGVPGTGKTTVCNNLLELMENSGRKITVINFGTVMVKLSQERGKSLHRDDLRRATLFFQRDIQTEAAETIAKEIERIGGDFVIDTHMIIKTPDGYYTGLPYSALQILSPEIFVLVEAEPSEVLNRRFKDETRKRDKVLEEEIAEEFLFSRSMAASCAVLTRASVKIVKNPAGKQVDAAEEILKLLER